MLSSRGANLTHFGPLKSRSKEASFKSRPASTSPLGTPSAVKMLFMITTSALAFSAAKSSVAVSTPKSNLPALDTRKSNLLALRGGGVVSTEVLYNTQAGLLMLTGFQGLLVPVNTLEMYGLKAADAESAWMRVVSGMNLVAAVSRLQIKPWADHAGRLSSRPCT